MRLGISYIVFDGIELLEHSIRQIRSHADFICVVYQRVSWFGAKLPDSSVHMLTSLQKKGLINELICFSAFAPMSEPSTSSAIRSKSYETLKRQVGLDRCIQNKCTHFLGMDVDEFYDTQEFGAAKSKINSQNIGSTAVRFINYVNLPTVHRGYDAKRVPFICRISNRSKMTKDFFVRCDPTRGISPLIEPKYEFSSSELTMHHMETVRRDLDTKYQSTTRVNFNRNKTQDLIETIKSVHPGSHTINFNGVIYPGQREMKLYSCDNRFNLPLFK